MRHQKAKKAVQIIISVLLCLLLLVNLFYIVERIAFNNEVPKVFGYSQVVVISGSMEPTLQIGDLLFIHEQKDYQVGDIITYQGETKLVTHRVVSIDGVLYTTKGDFNNVSDGTPAAITKIQGKVVLRIPIIGNLIFFLKSPFGMLVIILGLIALVEVPEIIKRKRASKK